MKKTISRAFAPATVANVGVGFDILGFAVKSLGEIAEVEAMPGDPRVILNPVDGHPTMPLEAARNTATAGLLQLIKDHHLNFGFRVTLHKQIPIGSGLGGSSASAVAAIVAANGLLKKKLSLAAQLEYAMIGEEVASGARHADNVAPCLYGGLVLAQTKPDLMVTPVKVPSALRCVIALPRMEIRTKDARGILRSQVALNTVIEQTSNLAGFLLGCAQNNPKLIHRSLRDVMIEPQRASLIPCFADLQGTAFRAGGLGCSISGSGPAIFALAANDLGARKILQAWKILADDQGIEIAQWLVSPISGRGAHLLRGKA